MTPETESIGEPRTEEPEEEEADEELDVSELAGISEHSAHEAGITPHHGLNEPEDSTSDEPAIPNVPSMRDFFRRSLIRATADTVAVERSFEDPEVSVLEPPERVENTEED